MNRMYPFLLALLITVAGVFAGIHGSSQQSSNDLIGDADIGKVLFEEYTCDGCHGSTAENGLGTRLNPPRMRQARFIQYLRNPTNPELMPPYQQPEASDQKLADIYAFLQSLPSASPPVEEIPVLQAILEEVPK